MLTRLKVSGFKNLWDVDVRFGPFTCIAGPNGVGKSNLFDAIRFLGALADRPLAEAAEAVREGGSGSDVRGLFTRQGPGLSLMKFEAEMLVPEQAVDDLGQPTKASITFLRYSLNLGYRLAKPPSSFGSLEIVKEELVHITRASASKHLLFPHSVKPWRDSVVKGRRAGGPFISTEESGDPGRTIRLHQDGGSRGRPLTLSTSLPRTVLSTVNAAESPTAVVARREMQSWRLLQLEPTALRKPDGFSSTNKMAPNGAHMPAALYRLAHTPNGDQGQPPDRLDPERVYARVANRLAALLDGIQGVVIDQDERRELLTLMVEERGGVLYPANALSDGTLRFLALSVLAEDPETTGVLCFEEPENGIHPDRIPAMLSLLGDIATDTQEPVAADNPLRQVIINTHSPAVVQQVVDDALLVAVPLQTTLRGQRIHAVSFVALSDTWRTKSTVEHEPSPTCSRGRLLSYLNPAVPFREEQMPPGTAEPSGRRPRVADREDMQLMLPHHSANG